MRLWKRRRSREEKWRDALPREARESQIALLKKYAPYTMTPAARQWALLNAVEYVDRMGVPGDFVECGVWKGGNPMLMLEAHAGYAPRRKVYCFDTFAGMTAPSPHDVRASDGAAAAVLLRKDHPEFQKMLVNVPLEEVKRNFVACGIDLADAIFVKGPVEQTLLEPANLPSDIAVLRLDTDFYESTLVELNILYPRLAAGGVLIIDDYGCWQGSRKAVDEYFGERKPLMNVVDFTCRIATKPIT